MQIVRVFLMILGFLVGVFGLYLLLLGIGVPVDIRTIELGRFKASFLGVGSGLVVAIFGWGVMVAAMKYLKKTQTTEVAEKYGRAGNLLSRVFKTTTKQFGGDR